MGSRGAARTVTSGEGNKNRKLCRSSYLAFAWMQRWEKNMLLFSPAKENWFLCLSLFLYSEKGKVKYVRHLLFFGRGKRGAWHAVGLAAAFFASTMSGRGPCFPPPPSKNREERGLRFSLIMLSKYRIPEKTFTLLTFFSLDAPKSKNTFYSMWIFLAILWGKTTLPKIFLDRPISLHAHGH